MTVVRAMPSSMKRVNFASIGKLVEIIALCSSTFAYPDVQYNGSWAVERASRFDPLHDTWKDWADMHDESKPIAMRFWPAEERPIDFKTEKYA